MQEKIEQITRKMLHFCRSPWLLQWLLAITLALCVAYSFLAITCYSEIVGEANHAACKGLYHDRYPVICVSVGTFAAGLFSHLFLAFTVRTSNTHTSSSPLRGLPRVGIPSPGTTILHSTSTNNSRASVGASTKELAVRHITHHQWQRRLFYILALASMFVIPILPLLIDVLNNRDWISFIQRVPNMSGVAAAIAMSWFMVPVSRQSPLLMALRWNPTDALTLHIWAGRVCFFFTLIHGVAEIVVSRIYVYPNEPWINMPQFYFLLPTKCWSFHNDRPDYTNQTAMSSFDFGTSCVLRVINWTGTMTGVALVLIIIVSANWIRRKYYWFFLQSHIALSWFFLLLLVVHLSNLVLYVLPPVLYYWACTSPTLVELVAVWMRGGHQPNACRFIADADGCYELSIAVSNRIRQSIVARPRFVRILCPSISISSHPFTVIDDGTHPTDQSKAMLRILIRPLGPFTKALAERLEQPTPPVLLVDGFYGGEDWVTECLLREIVVMVAGGVGIAPFLSVLPRLYSALENRSTSGDLVTRRVILHWCARDVGLIRHVIKNYFENMCQGHVSEEADGLFLIENGIAQPSSPSEISLDTTSGRRCSIEIHIHDTSIRNEGYTSSGTSIDLSRSSSQDNIISYQTTSSKIEKKPFAPFGLCADHCRQEKWVHCLIPSLLFATSFAAGVLAEEYHSKRDTKASEWMRLVYLIGVLTLPVLLCAAVMVLTEWSHHFRRFQWRVVSTDPSDTDSINSQSTDDNPSAGASCAISQLPVSIEGKVSLLNIDYSRGRLLPSAVTAHIKDSVPEDQTALFLCGPVEMMMDIRRSVKGQTNCTYFQEHFEL